MRSRRRLRHFAVAIVLALVGVFLTATAASAHVTVSSTSAVQGGYAVLTFRVPTESATASTTAMTVQFPTDTPLASVSVKPKAGWTYQVTKTTLNPPVKDDDGNSITQAVSTVVWTAADGVGIKPGEFDEFQVSAGPLPKVAKMTFKALQSYSDGSRVDWIDVAAAGSNAELAHPAPTLALSAATATADNGSGTDSADAASDNDGNGVAWAALVVGIVAVLGSAAAIVIGLRRTSTSSPND